MGVLSVNEQLLLLEFEWFGGWRGGGRRELWFKFLGIMDDKAGREGTLDCKFTSH